MTKRKPSTASSKHTKRPSKQSLAHNITEGLQELIAQRRGEIALRTKTIYIFDDVDVKVVREKTGLSQADFAFTYGFNPRTLQQWEQGRAKPETAVLAYLKVIDKDPESVRAALRS